MQLIKAAGRIFGAHLNAAEKKALDIEINKAIAQATAEHCQNVDATILWVMHDQLGFGVKRLRDFYMAFAPAILQLCKYYDMCDEQDSVWLCRRKIADLGIDLDAWRKEIEEKMKEENHESNSV